MGARDMGRGAEANSAEGDALVPRLGVSEGVVCMESATRSGWGGAVVLLWVSGDGVGLEEASHRENRSC